MRKKSSEYGRKLQMGQVYLKTYNKSREVWLNNRLLLSSTVIRIEMGLMDSKQLKFIPNLNTLKDINILKTLRRKLLDYFNRIQLDCKLPQC